MFIDFTIKPNYVNGMSWSTANVRVNTEKGAKAYNEYFCGEHRKGDTFTISARTMHDFRDMCDMNNCSLIFG